ncbi:MAG: glycerophosphodiester phosphodiesterase family protein [Lachnospiraceae bacterium]
MGVEIVLLVLLLLFLLYLGLLWPHLNRKSEMRAFTERHIAHRGLHSMEEGIPENSALAVEAAVAKGYGIELDVQMTRDRKIVVFHDADLLRACQIPEKINRCTYKELQAYTLFGTGQRIPLLKEVLQIVDGKVPVLLELKAGREYRTACLELANLLDAYEGKLAFFSFQPLAVRWFLKQRPKILRGMLLTNFHKAQGKQAWIISFIMGNSLLNFCTRPDFLAYNKNHRYTLSNIICQKLYGITSAVWTIRSQEELDKLNRQYEMIVFEGFIPKS